MKNFGFGIVAILCIMWGTIVGQRFDNFGMAVAAGLSAGFGAVFLVSQVVSLFPSKAERAAEARRPIQYHDDGRG